MVVNFVALAALVLSSGFSASALAMDLSFLGTQGPPGPPRSTLRHAFSIQPDIHQQTLNINFLTAQSEDGKNQLFVNARTGWMDLPSDRADLPDLYDLSAGLTFKRELPGDRALSVGASFGSASDKPFSEASVNTLGVTASYSLASPPSSRWVLLVNYSNNRPILNGLPLPGFAYFYMPSRQFRLTVGAPFAAMQWEFVDRWSLNLMTVVPWIFRGSVGYRVVGPLQLFAGADFSQQTYLRAGRTHRDERIFHDEKKATIGARSPLSRSLFAELETGLAFGRRFFDADSYTDPKTRLITLENGWILKTSVSVSF